MVGADKIIGVDINEDKVELAKKFGMTDFINPKETEDVMNPYRLEMGTKLQINGWKNLYEFWGESVKKDLLKDSDTIVNLASNEYYKVLGNISDEANVVSGPGPALRHRPAWSDAPQRSQAFPDTTKTPPRRPPSAQELRLRLLRRL